MWDNRMTYSKLIYLYSKMIAINIIFTTLIIIIVITNNHINYQTHIHLLQKPVVLISFT